MQKCKRIVSHISRDRPAQQTPAQEASVNTAASSRNVHTVYRLYRERPEEGRSSYLHDHYKRGRQGIMKPHGQLALAAWKAGRDAAKAETQQ